MAQNAQNAEIIEWKDAEPRLAEIISPLAASVNGAGLASNFPFEVNYRFVYDVSRGWPKAPGAATERSQKIYDLLLEKAEEFLMEPGHKRDMFLRLVSYVFKYYEKCCMYRVEDPWRPPSRRWDVTTLMSRAMDDVLRDRKSMEIAQKHFLKKSFIGWALNEELLGPTHADGGAAKKRQLELWEHDNKRLCVQTETDV